MKNIRAKKSLGQNFLKSKKVLEKIVKVSDLKEEDIVLEVGPGKGALTKKILEKSIKKLIVVEKDHRMIELLEDKFFEEIKSGKMEIVNEDILQLDFNKYNLENNNYKIIANLPYYITGQFLRKTLESKNTPSLMTLLLQKEVVERITSRRLSDEIISDMKKKKEKENILSLSIKAYGEPFYITSVSAKNFNPAPKVDSAVLLIKNISKSIFIKNNISEKLFFDFIKLAFSSKRKKMIKNLSTKIRNSDKIFYNKKNLEEAFDKLSINKNYRAEDLSINNFIKIISEYKKQID